MFRFSGPFCLIRQTVGYCQYYPCDVVDNKITPLWSKDTGVNGV